MCKIIRVKTLRDTSEVIHMQYTSNKVISLQQSLSVLLYIYIYCNVKERIVLFKELPVFLLHYLISKMAPCHCALKWHWLVIFTCIYSQINIFCPSENFMRTTFISIAQNTAYKSLLIPSQHCMAMCV